MKIKGGRKVGTKGKEAENELEKLKEEWEKNKNKNNTPVGKEERNTSKGEIIGSKIRN